MERHNKRQRCLVSGTLVAGRSAGEDADAADSEGVIPLEVFLPSGSKLCFSCPWTAMPEKILKVVVSMDEVHTT